MKETNIPGTFFLSAFFLSHIKYMSIFAERLTLTGMRPLPTGVLPTLIAMKGMILQNSITYIHVIFF
jgi:uncharacterized membrane protein YhhN